jgi:MFS transporter, CP family, cyanate transporter
MPGFFVAIALLWLAGNALRLTILAIPPVIPMMKADLNLSATEVGVLAGIPVILFSVAALPGSLLIARFGAVRTLLGGLVISGIASGLRGACGNALTLDAATVLVGFGVAIMQPAMPPLVRQWLPRHVGFGTAVYTNGLLVGEILPVGLTLPFVVPLTGGGWRWSLVVWGGAVVAIAIGVTGFAPHSKQRDLAISRPRGWPNWRNSLIWRLGLIFGSVNSIYFATNAFLPVYLASAGRNAAISGALTALNVGQLPASLLLLAIADRIAGQVWPYALAGAAAILGVGGVVFAPESGAIAAAALVGFACGATLILTLALPPLLCRPEEVGSTTAAMFTMSYGSAVVTPIVSGALWDVTGVPAAAFIPIGVCAAVLLAFAPAMKFHQVKSEDRALKSAWRKGP